MLREATIVAQATAVGSASIAVIRLSGSESLPLLQKIFFKKNKEYEPNQFYFGSLIDPSSGLKIDEAMAVYFKAPHSFTGEDIVEIQCHGSQFLVEKVLKILLSIGAAQAGPGEFTRRAFLNGKMDLSQAEAVAQLIASESEQALNQSIQQLDGYLTSVISDVREKLIHLLAEIEAGFDFTEEDIQFISPADIQKKLNEIFFVLKKLTDSYQTGERINRHFKVALVGRPNVGKSSLLNVLLRENKAIVNEKAGTTRDLVEGERRIKNIRIRLIDTAGLRESLDSIEMEGIGKTREIFSKADLVLVVIDGSKELSLEDEEILKSAPQNSLIVVNKKDLGLKIDLKKFKNFLLISTKTEEGVEALLDKIYDALSQDYDAAKSEFVLTNVRHFELLLKSEKILETSIQSGSAALECLVEDLKRVIKHCEEILGKIDSEDVLDKVFSSFCIGK